MDYATADDLLKIYGNRNPISNFIYDNQLADQSQFRQLGMQEKGLTNRSKELENLFTEQNNPIRLQDNQAILAGRRIKNDQDTFALAKTARTHEADVNLTLKKAVSGLKEQDLKDLKTEAERLKYSNDPNERQLGLELMMLGEEFQKVLFQGQQSRETAAQQQTHAKELERIKTKNQRDLEQMRIDSGKYSRGGITKTVDDMLLTARSSKQKAEILEQAYYTAWDNNDMALATRYKQRAMEARARAAEDANNTGLGTPGLGLGANGELTPKPRPAAVAPIAGAATSPQPSPQLPPGAKQVGTSRGRPVYEINGKQFILE